MCEEPSKRDSDNNAPSHTHFCRGIATKGSPWEYMLDLRDSGYDGVVPVHLGPLGKYNFLLSPESVKAATVEEASTLSRRFSVPLFETLELDRGLVYEQGSRHKRHKKICVPSFEQARSMEAFVGATRQEMEAQVRHLSHFERKHEMSAFCMQTALIAGVCMYQSQRFAACARNRQVFDLYAEMRESTLVMKIPRKMPMQSARTRKDAQQSQGAYMSRAHIFSC